MTQETLAINTLPRPQQDFTTLLEHELRHAIDVLEGDAPLMARMTRYHLGWSDPSGEPTSDAVRRAVQGKRIRPFLAVRSCEAVGGNPANAAPLAAAIELLHNFTLIHDDIQDRSPNRRHRATVWRIWGDAQAINAGDALFACAQRALLRTKTDVVPASTLLRLMDELNRATVEIVRGQVLDLEFERQVSVSPGDYLSMISGKTAAIMRFAAWAGAIVGGATEDTAHLLGRVGEALGIGFQIQDDVLGIWGAREQTGKDQADDIRRRKKSLPILMLFEAARGADANRLLALYGSDGIDDQGVSDILDMVDRYGVRELASAEVSHYHALASNALVQALSTTSGGNAEELTALIERLDTRVS